MKKYLKSNGLRTLLGTCLLFILCTAAVKSVPDTSKRVGGVISLEKMDILYVGLENPVCIAVSGYEPDQVTVVTEGIMLRPTGKALCYTLNPDGQTKKAKISVFVKGLKDAVCIKECRIMPVPEPEILLGSLNVPVVSKAELIGTTDVKLKLDPIYPGCGIIPRVVGFTLVHASLNGGKASFFHASDSKVTPEMQQSFQEADPGDVIAITDVKIAGPGGAKTRNGPTLIVQ